MSNTNPFTSFDGADDVVGKTMGEAFPAMMRWIGKMLRYSLIAYLASGSLQARAAKYRYYGGHDGERMTMATTEKGDDIIDVVKGLPTLEGKTLSYRRFRV